LAGSATNKVGVIGAGKIGGSLIQRLSESGNFDLTVSDVHAEQLDRFAKSYGVKTTNSNLEAAEAADILVVAVKPWDVGTILDEAAPAFDRVGGEVIRSTVPFLWVAA